MILRDILLPEEASSWSQFLAQYLIELQHLPCPRSAAIIKTAQKSPSSAGIPAVLRDLSGSFGVGPPCSL